MFKLILIVALVGQGPATGKEMFFSANELKHYCNSITYTGEVRSETQKAAADVLSCTEYIKGIVDAFGFAIWATNDNPTICIPRGTTAISLVNIVKYFMYQNLKKWDFSETPAAAVVVVSLADAFPCEETSPFEDDIIW